MSGVVASEPRTPRARRRIETTAEIVAAAWRLARRDGLPSIAMRELGREVGLRAQSLYGYFDSKAALYDAMFREGHERLAELMAVWDDELSGLDLRDEAKQHTARFVAFCTDDPVRYQLLFQRIIPGWEPSAGSYALAVEQLAALRRLFERAGIEGDEILDLYTAMVSGLISQQLSNDPGGDRWTRLVDTAIDLFFDQYRIDDTSDQGDTP